jgi:hypothetical protein
MGSVMRKNRHPMIVQRVTKKRLEQEERERQLMEDRDRDPRRASRQIGRYDQARIYPLIEDD